MKRALIILFVLPIFTLAQTSTLEFDNSETAMKLVNAYVDGLQNGDVDKMNAQLAGDAFIHNLGGALDSLNTMQHKEYYKNSLANYNHKITRDLYLPVKVEDSWNEGEWVLTWGTNTLTNKTSGTETRVPYHIAIMVVDGKIKTMYYFYDMLNVLKNQGYKMVPPTEQ